MHRGHEASALFSQLLWAQPMRVIKRRLHHVLRLIQQEGSVEQEENILMFMLLLSKLDLGVPRRLLTQYAL